MKKTNKFYEFPLEIKSLDEDGYFNGYASIYNIEDSHGDIIISGAFCESLRKKGYGRDIKLLWQHKTDEPIGIFTKVIEDDIGLYVDGQLLHNVARAREAHELLKIGALDGLSIGFIVKDYEYSDDSYTRIIYEADLIEISLVTFPENEEARVTQVKSGGHKNTIQNIDNAIAILAS